MGFRDLIQKEPRLPTDFSHLLYRHSDLSDTPSIILEVLLHRIIDTLPVQRCIREVVRHPVPAASDMPELHFHAESLELIDSLFETLEQVSVDDGKAFGVDVSESKFSKRVDGTALQEPSEKGDNEDSPIPFPPACPVRHPAHNVLRIRLDHHPPQLPIRPRRIDVPITRARIALLNRLRNPQTLQPSVQLGSLARVRVGRADHRSVVHRAVLVHEDAYAGPRAGTAVAAAGAVDGDDDGVAVGDDGLVVVFEVIFLFVRAGEVGPGVVLVLCFDVPGVVVFVEEAAGVSGAVELAAGVV